MSLLCELFEVVIEDYLKSLGQGDAGAELGEFTIAAERAKALLGGKALSDVWQAWLCMAQGFIAQGARSLDLSCSRESAVWRVDLPDKMLLEDLLRDDRFLLGWLNLGWFGTPEWNEEESTLVVPWQGSAWKKYRFSATFPQTMKAALKFAAIPIQVGSQSIGFNYLPLAEPMCLYSLPKGRAGGIAFADVYAENQGPERRRFALPGVESEDSGLSNESLAAFAYRTKSTWSEVTWVSHGVVIGTERNTLERPTIRAVASVQALGLETDLSGFKVVNDERYYRFITALKRDVLWML